MVEDDLLIGTATLRLANVLLAAGRFAEAVEVREGHSFRAFRGPFAHHPAHHAGHPAQSLVKAPASSCRPSRKIAPQDEKGLTGSPFSSLSATDV
ncbi:hypothetical protein AB0K60_16035 [Thermopolyspora sp. NPDC052614]|uniref:hypothetical protein n=1 Tax=Thermopolyspora sp. NPDC052614 TaxID=3155682 RepID=UPI0034138CE1